MKFLLSVKKYIAPLLAWLFIYLAIVPMQLSNYVLCIDANGDAELKTTFDGQCIDTYILLNKKQTEAAIADDSCIDIAIFVSLNTQQYLLSTESLLVPQPILGLPFLMHQTLTYRISTLTYPQVFPPWFNPTLKFIRTTTLLI